MPIEDMSNEARIKLLENDVRECKEIIELHEKVLRSFLDYQGTFIKACNDFTTLLKEMGDKIK